MAVADEARLVWASCVGAPFARVVFDSYLAAGGPPPDQVLLVPPDETAASMLFSLSLAARGTQWRDLRLLNDPAVRAGVGRRGAVGNPYRAAPGVPVNEVGSINSPEARTMIGSSDAPTVLLASSLPQILHAATLAQLWLGALNLHLGAMPDYRGHFATYWEMRDKRPTGGVTVHRMVTKVDAGAPVAVAHVPMTGRSLLRVTVDKKRLGGQLLACALSEVVRAGVPPAVATDAEPLPPARPWPGVRDVLVERLVG